MQLLKKRGLKRLNQNMKKCSKMIIDICMTQSKNICLLNKTKDAYGI